MTKPKREGVTPVAPAGRHGHHPTGGNVIPLQEATRAWFAISLQTFGGPAGQIAVMQHKLVDEKRWIGQQRFLHALNYCMLLPGPEAQQLAIYTGWLLNGTAGGLIAGILFVLPGMLALLGLTILYLGRRRHQPGHRTVRRPRPGRHRHRHPGRLPGRETFPDPPPPGRAGGGLVRRAGAVRGAVPARVYRRGRCWAGCCRRWVPALRSLKAQAADDGPPPLISDDALHADKPSAAPSGPRPRHRAHALVRAGAARAGRGGREHRVRGHRPDCSASPAWYSFGGAYAVLAYVAQQAVEVYGWLAPGEMVQRPRPGRDHARARSS